VVETGFGLVRLVFLPRTSRLPSASARDLGNLFGATSHATVVDSDQAGRYNVSVTFGGLNDEELQTVTTIGLRSDGFRDLTADEVTTLAAITRMEEFRREDRFL
jgi:hypothetical protein